jgi:hypothetical protein
MAGLVPAIHVFVAAKTWMPGTRPGMTIVSLYAAFLMRSRPYGSPVTASVCIAHFQ